MRKYTYTPWPARLEREGAVRELRRVQAHGERHARAGRERPRGLVHLRGPRKSARSRVVKARPSAPQKSGQGAAGANSSNPRTETAPDYLEITGFLRLSTRCGATRLKNSNSIPSSHCLRVSRETKKWKTYAAYGSTNAPVEKQ